MKKLLISTLILTSAACFGAATPNPKAKILAANGGITAATTPAATHVATAPNKVAKGFFAGIVRKAANMKASTIAERFDNLQTETADAVTEIQALDDANQLSVLTKEQKDEILKGLTVLWKEANDLINKNSFAFYLLPDNDQLRTLKSNKNTIAELVRQVSGRVESLSWKIESFAERRGKLISALTGLYLGHRTGYLYTAAYNMFQPKKAWTLFKYLAIPAQFQPKAVAATPAPSNSWF